MREIASHHDGHGLAEKLRITADDQDPNGASHRYTVHYWGGVPGGSPGRIVAEIQFQKGPREEEDSTSGILDSCLLAIVLDRLQGFQRGPMPSRENAIIITKLEESLMWMKKRADERAARGVLGKNIK